VGSEGGVLTKSLDEWKRFTNTSTAQLEEFALAGRRAVAELPYSTSLHSSIMRDSVVPAVKLIL
jgi:hypothetical protein